MQLQQNLYQKDKLEAKPTRHGYGDGLVESGKQDPNVVVLCADLSDSTRSEEFHKVFPERFFEVGISEQDMAGIAAGLALSGKIPFISTYAVFCPGRNWDQIRVSVAYNKANVKIGGAHAGVSVGPDGATHQALEDIATVRCLPNMIVLVPCDYIQTKKATLSAAKIQGPVYLRFAREATPIFTTYQTPFEIGKAQIFREGKDVTVAACGPTVYEALLAAKSLEKEHISVEVINNHTIKPIDQKTLVDSVKKTGCLVTAEDHQVMGGMGSAVLEAIAGESPVPTQMIGVGDRFGESGSPDELMREFNLLADDITQAIKKVLSLKSKN